ncbi:MAG: hypothetical protein MN733_35645, partial [Nitrososphaera sp.]|nr:hypothetical protein [Nitrososphaera sp.]
FESKAAAHSNVVRIKEADFKWLVEEYERRKHDYKSKHGVQNFDQFADVFLRELLEKVNTARRTLTF